MGGWKGSRRAHSNREEKLSGRSTFNQYSRALPWFHDTKKHANSRVEADHGRLKARPGPCGALKKDRTAAVIVKAHAFVQNLRRGL